VCVDRDIGCEEIERNSYKKVSFIAFFVTKIKTCIKVNVKLYSDTYAVDESSNWIGDKGYWGFGLTCEEF